LWSRDGRQLFYRVAPDALMVVDVTPGPPFQAGRPRQVFTRVFGGVTGFGAPIFNLGRDNRWLFLSPRETLHARIDVLRHVLR
jgi:hypothetical protein